MFRITELHELLLKKPRQTDCGISCESVNNQIALLNRLIGDRLSYFSFTIVLSGYLKINCEGRIIVLQENDLFITVPGSRVYTEEVTEDFSGLCLMIEEITAYEMPYARDGIRASYFPMSRDNANKLSFSATETQRLVHRMEEIKTCMGSDHIYKTECLYALFSLFILDLLDIGRHYFDNNSITPQTSDLFLRFLRLATENFIDQHEIAFYSDALAVSSIYLSRIVKRISGQTVKNHLDRLLMMEASYLLTRTDIPIAAIAERLNFANPGSFCKFFNRHKGISPKDYRKSSTIQSTGK